MLGAIGTKGPNGDNSDYNRVYATLGLDGPILQNLVYSITTTFSNYTGAEALSNLTQASVTFYPNFMYSSISANFLYASSETSSTSEFTGISSQTATLAYDEPEYANLIKAGLKGSIKPLDVLLVNVGFDLVWSADDSGAYGYDGFQLDAGAQYQLFTDVLLSASVGTYFAKDTKRNNTNFTVKAVLSF